MVAHLTSVASPDCSKNGAISSNVFIAHYRTKDGAVQTVSDHLNETADLTSLFSTKIELPLSGKLLGLLHDIGKYSSEFQLYIREGCGLCGDEGEKRAKEKKGKIDHATSGAQIIWDAYKSNRIPQSLAQILSVVIMSHHSPSGMKDFINLTGESPFLKRLHKTDIRTFKTEILRESCPTILNEINQILDSPDLVAEFKAAITKINKATPLPIPCHNAYALLTRFLFSCLLDADRINTSNFESPTVASYRVTDQTPNWQSLLETFESHIGTFKANTEINKIRCQISDECRDSSTRPENLLTLQVPTGGGKTLASLRFALHRAASDETHPVDRIIYLLPYTSIIEQNAEEIRKILGEDVILEHHSNLSDERDSWKNRVLSENWDAPIVFTTTVQLLNSLFATGTKTARRMHQLSNSILIFDEIQSLPIKTIHLFNNAINFLCLQANTTIVLCTATMPLLQSVDQNLGAIPITEKSGIIGDKTTLFKKLKRTEIINDCRPDKWSNIEVSDYALGLRELHKSLLIVCNTKSSAQNIFDLLRANTDVPVIHLSTNMCPAHRRHRITEIRTKLDPANPKPVICISTQLIEAGVDLDFGCVIRSLAGLDSIIQAAGRCNRHGHREIGFVHILNLREEKLYAALKDIEIAQEITQRILNEFQDDPKSFDDDLLSEKAMNQFYFYYFYQRANEMPYPCKAGKGQPPLAQDCDLLELLSRNSPALQEASRIKNTEPSQLRFHHAHSTASQAFQVIDAPTRGIIVPYDKDDHEGSKIISDLAASYTNEAISLADQVRLHKKAQQYTVNAFPHIIEKLAKSGALYEIQPGEGIYYLDERHYHDDLGITLEALSEQNYLGVHT